MVMPRSCETRARTAPRTRARTTGRCTAAASVSAIIAIAVTPRSARPTKLDGIKVVLSAVYQPPARFLCDKWRDFFVTISAAKGGVVRESAALQTDQYDPFRRGRFPVGVRTIQAL